MLRDFHLLLHGSCPACLVITLSFLFVVRDFFTPQTPFSERTHTRTNHEKVDVRSVIVWQQRRVWYLAWLSPVLYRLKPSWRGRRWQRQRWWRSAQSQRTAVPSTQLHNTKTAVSSSNVFKTTEHSNLFKRAEHSWHPLALLCIYLLNEVSFIGVFLITYSQLGSNTV